MKKIIFFILYLSIQSLMAQDMVDTFLDAQIKVESKFLDQSLSLDKKVSIKKSQTNEYQNFLLDYTIYHQQIQNQSRPYHNEINKLNLSLRNNKYLRDSIAIKHDKVLLKNYALRNAIRQMLSDTIMETGNASKAYYKDKINEILIKHFSTYKTLDTKKYNVSDMNQSNPKIASLVTAINNQGYLENVANTFSAELVENSLKIYKTARISKSKFFTLLNTINTSSYGIKLNSYLSYFNLDAAKIILLLVIILLIIIIRYIIRFIITHVLQYYKIKEDDIEYIHSHITKIFMTITSLFIIQLIVVVYLGVDTKSINISKLFAVIYVILTAQLLYRITNTVAYMYIEAIRSSKFLKNEVINLAIKVANGFIILVAFIAILKIGGVNLTAVLSGLGIAGAAVAFAAKDSISNVFGSISILAGDVFEQGDWIETKDINGTVVEIGLRASTIRTFDNALISIPNSELANKGVKNWSRRSVGRRIKMNIGVTYQAKFDDIRQAIIDIRAMLKEHPGIANERTEYQSSYRQAKLVSSEDFKGVKRTTLVYMDEFSDSSINILVYCFSRSVDWDVWLEVKEDVMYKIADILEKNNLEFAYPTLTLHQAENENIPTIEK